MKRAAGSYGTIMIKRQGSNVMKRFFGGGVMDQLLRDASGNPQWAVEYP